MLFLAFVALFCVSSYKIGSQLMADHAEKQAFADLLSQVNADRETGAGAAPAGVQAAQETALPPDAESSALDEDDTSFAVMWETESGGQTAAELSGEAGEETNRRSDAADDRFVLDPDPTPQPPVLPAYASLYAQNPDLFGWIEIEGTDINFPVMHTPRDSEYYLHRAFDGSYSNSGVPFMDGNCYVGCGNYLIYGHHMKNGAMFAPIVNYAKEDYWQAHPVVQFNTIYEMGTYEVIAAFYTQVDTDGVFPYYDYLDLNDPEAFEEYVWQVKAASVYDPGIEVAYGDPLLTLTTCEYHAQNGRFVVVARKTEQ